MYCLKKKHYITLHNKLHHIRVLAWVQDC